ncbi:MAG: hypothetical protein D6730_21370 [Bacteroidetes bacterium]|nr:MAG: hypothetical protein D6730_21370 [Bacteroidota bacterium]
MKIKPGFYLSLPGKWPEVLPAHTRHFLLNSMLMCVLGLGFLLVSPHLNAQEIPPEELEQYKAECEDLVSFLQFTLNTIGDPATSVRDKDVIINESYLKMFRDPEVQIEDDLEESRRVVTNKDVQAYLKDVDFFFQQVRFEFTIEDITHHLNEDGQIYFVISLNRNLQGITVKGDTINLTQPRFIEVNLDQEQKDLKIVSIYTTKLSEKEELSNWWESLPYEWKWFFGKDISINDSLNMRHLLAVNDSLKIGDTIVFNETEMLVLTDSTTTLDMLTADNLKIGDTVYFRQQDTIYTGSPLVIAHLKNLLASTSLDISSHPELRELQPLAKFTQLRELNISNTEVSSLVDLRNLTRLEVLRCNNTQVEDLSPLKYAFDLKELYCHHTPLSSLYPVSNFRKLEKLHIYETNIDELSELRGLRKLKELLCDRTLVSNLAPLSGLEALSLLKCGHTQIQSLEPLAGLSGLEVLDIEGNLVTDLTPLRGLPRLRILFCDSTLIESLEPLGSMPALTKVYCDNTPITRQQANAFMKAHPGILVVYGSAQLSEWWSEMPTEWQTVFRQYVRISPQATREELHELANLEQVDVAGNTGINTLAPLSMLINLQTLNCSNTRVSDLQPLADLVNLHYLNCSQTLVSSLEPLKNLVALRILLASQTQVSDLRPLVGLRSLELLNLDQCPLRELAPLQHLPVLKTAYCDQTLVTREQVMRLSELKPDLLVVYQTQALQQWWQGLSPLWQQIFRTHVKTSETPTREELHRMMLISSLEIPPGSAIGDLSPIKDLFRLKKIVLANTRTSSLAPLAGIKSLEEIDCSNNPLPDLSPLAGLPKLTKLNCENTPVEDLSPLSGLQKLEYLQCGGTQIKDLKALETLSTLKYLNCSNTDIKSLKPLRELPNLLQLVCFNTRLKQKKVDKFKKEHPNTEITFYGSR